jgi:hypothetical protein
MKYENIRNFSQRCEEHPDHQSGMISHQMLLDRAHEEIDELREFIEQAQQQEPVAWDGKCVLGHCGSPSGCEDSHCCRADYTTPPQRQPLTDEEIDAKWRKATELPTLTSEFVRSFARAIEQAHGIKGEA